ncbi:MAG: InlB B-repeat-containing protein [Clostridia bacterium]|nr:InlB B-repeat-containing protein [Clostridia bacterium]
MKNLFKRTISALIATAMIFSSIPITGLITNELSGIGVSQLKASASSAPISVAVSTSPENIKFDFDSNVDPYINGVKTEVFSLDVSLETDSAIGEDEVFFVDTVITLPDSLSFEDGEQVKTDSGTGFTSDGKKWTIPFDIYVSNPLGLINSEIIIEVYFESNLIGNTTVPILSASTKSVLAYFMHTDGLYLNYKTTKNADENGNVLGFSYERTDENGDMYYSRNVYTLTLNVDGTESSYMCYYGSQIDVLYETPPSKEGYGLAYWVDENGDSPPEYMPAYDLTLTAKWTDNALEDTNKAYFYLDDACEELYATSVVDDAGNFEYPSSYPKKEGHTFAGWSDEGNNRYVALWYINSYRIYFMDGECELVVIQCEYGSAVSMPLNPSKDGYTFVGWADATGNMYSDGFIMPADVLYLYAVWTVDSTPEEYICIYSTNPTLSTPVYGQFDLSFSLYNNGEVVSDWNKFALTLGNNDIIYVSEYKENEEGFYVTVTGLEPGFTTLTVTDTVSGAYNNVTLEVFSSDCSVSSYRMDNVPEFYPENTLGSNEILTNFYNINGLYISDYNYIENESSNIYTVTFNAYNYFAHHGSVDVYDKNGKWIKSDCIAKATTPSSLFDVGESIFYLVSDAVTGKFFSYKAATYSEKSEIKVEVPEGGYFTISNNFTQSLGTFIYNVVDYLMAIVKVFIGASSGSVESVSDEIIDKLVDSEMVNDILVDKLHNIALDAVDLSLRTGYGEAAGAVTTDFEDLLNTAGISWKSVFKGQMGIGEEIFTKITGPAGIALDVCFSFVDAVDLINQTNNLFDSKNAEYVAIHTPSEFNNSSMNEVTVSDPNNCIDDDSVIQVFKILKNDEIKVTLNKTTSFDDYRIYNISIVKDGKNVNPNGKVTVAIPIPEGFNGETCSVLRQEEDGSWTILEARVEGNYLVFETDHFSLYALTGNYIENISLYTKPDKTNYDIGDVLDITGLSLVINNSDGTEEIVSEGLVCSPTVLSTQGVQTISVYYGDLCCKFKVNVGLNNIKLSILTPASRTINYGESIKLQANTANLPSNAKIKWVVDGEGVKLNPSSSGRSCKVTATSTGNVVISAYVVDRNGNIITDENGKIISDSEYFYSEANLWLKIVYFFKKLFGISLISSQVFKDTF